MRAIVGRHLRPTRRHRAGARARRGPNRHLWPRRNGRPPGQAPRLCTGKAIARPSRDIRRFRRCSTGATACCRPPSNKFCATVDLRRARSRFEAAQAVASGAELVGDPLIAKSTRSSTIRSAARRGTMLSAARNDAPLCHTETRREPAKRTRLPSVTPAISLQLPTA